MTLVEGNVAASGGFAFVSQQAWILNDSLKENILFGNQYDKNRLALNYSVTMQDKKNSNTFIWHYFYFRYYAVLEACCLLPDLAELSYGDMTEVYKDILNYRLLANFSIYVQSLSTLN